ncbi:mono-functional DNA-alkylating methyl methanesulfonate N-term-domain-containing protein [Coprinopsis sp. MPI-PUGE-AT-0042]|nr:mono-functional DNA-alkylating methyl methanesulfonate N-term-domain-containing protein [Coprinopsis sp. MPI-PUGE-AT-0042]
MKIVTTFHASSSVVSSVKCCLSSRNLEHLVIAKLDRLDVYSLRPNGLQYECGVDIWGKVLCVRAIPISNTGRSKLVLMTSHPDPELVFFAYKELEDGGAALSVTKSISLHERSPREAEFCNDLLIHPSGKLAVASCYAGKLKIIKLKAGDYVQDFDLALAEFNLLSLAFLPVDEYALAILHLDNQSRVKLLAREIPSEAEAEVSNFPSVLLQTTVIPNKIITYPADLVPQLIPVPPGGGTEGGMLIIGGTSILHYELASEDAQNKTQGKLDRIEKQLSDPDPEKVKQAKAKMAERESKKRKSAASVPWPWEEVATWCEVGSGRFFIGDICGGLSLLSVDKTGLTLVPLGRTSPPTTLTYLTNQIIFAGSHLGDSQLVQISPTPSGSAEDPIQTVPDSIKTVSRNISESGRISKGKGRAMEEDSDMDVDSEPLGNGRVITPQGSHLKVLQAFKNIGPINDAVLVDLEGSGQKDIITCSGGYNTGSLNVVRNGAEFKEMATVPGIYNVQSLWSLRMNFEDKVDSHLVASTHERSFIFRLNDDGRQTTFAYLDSAHARDFVTKEPTIALGNVCKRTMVNKKSTYGDSNWVVQVTGSGVLLLEENAMIGGYEKRAAWNPIGAEEIVAASINPTQIALAVDGKTLNAVKVVILRVNERGTAFELIVEKPVWRAISAISCISIDPSKRYATHFAVAYWDPGTDFAEAPGNVAVEVFELKASAAGQTFNSIASVPKKTLPGLVRSLLPFDFGTSKDDQHSYLLCGTVEGSVAHFVWRNGNLLDHKIVSLGYMPVNLVPCVVDGKKAVWAVGNRATIFTYEKKRLTHSPVTLKDLAAACTINTGTFKNSFVLSSPQGLAIGSIGNVGKISIRTIPMGFEVPQRIVHIPQYQAFAVACMEHIPGRLAENPTFRSCLKLVDDSSFKVLSEFTPAHGGEEIISALEMITVEVAGQSQAFICAGTTTGLNKKARLTVLSANTSNTSREGRELAALTSKDVNGSAINAIRIVNGYVVVAVDSAVMSYAFRTGEDGTTFSLEVVAEWNHNYVVRSLGSFNKRVVIGDIASSVSLVDVGDGKVESVARDYAPLFPFALEALSEDSFIGANDASNLFSFTLGQRGMNRKALDRDGSYFLGDLPTKFIRGNMSSDSTSIDTFEPVSIFFTSSGGIGIIIDIKDQDLARHLSELQRNMSAQFKGIGAPSHSSFRAPRNNRSRTDAEASAVGFIDGDFIETFLGLIGNDGKVDKVMAGQIVEERLKLSVDKFQKHLETLQALH